MPISKILNVLMQIVFVDLGAATQGKYSTIANPGVADDYAYNAITGGNLDLQKPELKRLLEQNLESPFPTEVGAPHPAICGGAIHSGILVGTAIDAGCGLPSFADDLEGIVDEALPSGVPTTIEGIPPPKTSSPEIISPRKLSVEVDPDISIESGKFTLDGKKYTYDPVDGWKGGFFGQKPDAQTTARLETARMQQVVNSKPALEEGQQILTVTRDNRVVAGTFDGIDLENTLKPSPTFGQAKLKNGVEVSSGSVNKFSKSSTRDPTLEPRLIIEGDFVRVRTLDGTAAVGRFDGIKGTDVLLTDKTGRKKIPLANLDSSSILKEGDEVVIGVTRPVGYREGAVTEIRGRYFENENSIILLTDDGVVTIPKGDVNVDSLRRAVPGQGKVVSPVPTKLDPRVEVVPRESGPRPKSDEIIDEETINCPIVGNAFVGLVGCVPKTVAPQPALSPADQRRAEKFVPVRRNLGSAPEVRNLLGNQPTVGQTLEALRLQGRTDLLRPEVIEETVTALGDIAQADILHGTSSKILPGLVRTDGKLIPTGELLQQGIPPYGGELKYGASSRGVSQKHVSFVEMETGGAELKYARDDFNKGWNPELGKADLEEQEKLLAEVESGDLKLPKTIQDQIVADIDLRKLRLDYWGSFSAAEKELIENPFPLVIGVDADNLVLNTNIGGRLQGEVAVQGGADLTTRRVILFTDEQHKAALQAFMKERFGIDAKVYSLESLELSYEVRKKYAYTGSENWNQYQGGYFLKTDPAYIPKLREGYQEWLDAGEPPQERKWWEVWKLFAEETS